jgi:hypothetical protein
MKFPKRIGGACKFKPGRIQPAACATPKSMLNFDRSGRGTMRAA